jgi:hypothetical protein
MKRGTIQTTFHNQQRVSFSCPPDGYCIDDLDALAVAIRYARMKLLEQHARDDNSVAVLRGELTSAFNTQQARMAAPS